MPERSAVDTYLEVSRRFPTQETMPLKVVDLDINEERVRMKGNVGDFDGIDKIVAGLSDGVCFSNVEKGKARNINEGVEFSISFDLYCEKAPGKPLPEGSKPAKRTVSAALKTANDGKALKKPTSTPIKGVVDPSSARNLPAADKIKEAQERARQRAEEARERAKERLEQQAVDPSPADLKRQERLEKLKRIREQRNRMRTIRSDDIDGMAKSRITAPGIYRLRAPVVTESADDDAREPDADEE